MQENMIDVRVFFSKTGRLKYISHLDTMRALQRALTRSDLPIWYTQGFNPHVYLTFALPLSLGVEGWEESFDFRLTTALDMEEVADRLNQVLMPELRVLRCAAPQKEPAEIEKANYRIELIYPPSHKEEIVQKWKEFIALPVLEVQKKSKKGMKTVDLAPYVEVESTEEQEDRLCVQMTLAAGTQLNINPSLYLDAWDSFAGCSPVAREISRLQLRCKDGSVFA